MNTENIDGLFLELSQFTEATTSKELNARNRADTIMNIIKHGQGDVLKRCYEQAKHIYEAIEGKPHYWHEDGNGNGITEI